MTACKVELVWSYVADTWSITPLLAPVHSIIIRHANMTGQMGYQKLYFENSTYKYYVRKHMQVLKIQKKAYKEHFYFQHKSGKVIATGREPLCYDNILS